jgi:hypothetical protein
MSEIYYELDEDRLMRDIEIVMNVFGEWGDAKDQSYAPEDKAYIELCSFYNEDEAGKNLDYILKGLLKIKP